MASQPLRRDEAGLAVSAHLTHYWRDGYAIVRRLLRYRMKSLKFPTALDQLYDEGAAHGRCFRHE